MIDLSGIDRKTIAVVYVSDGTYRVYRGTARYQREKGPGNAVRITIDQEQEENRRLDIIIPEEKWYDLLVSGAPFGCDFLLRLIRT